MDKVKLIYNRIEKRLDEICDDGFVLKENQQEYETLTDLEDFINSIPKEPNEDLDKEIDKIWKTCEPIDEGMGVETANIHIEQFDDIARHFAKWQEKKMLGIAEAFYLQGRHEQEQQDLEDSLKSDMTMPNKFYEKGKTDVLKEIEEALQTEYEKGRFDAMQDFLEKACEYLAPINYTHPHLIDLDDFKNYMQNE